MMRTFYLHVTETTFALVPGRLTADQLRQGRIQHYENGVTLHHAQGKYLVAEPQGYGDGSTLYYENRSLAAAHHRASSLSRRLPFRTGPRPEVPLHGVAPYTDAQRLRDAWDAR